ncbi:Hypothetical protein, putative, partial [Bodo saltans]
NNFDTTGVMVRSTSLTLLSGGAFVIDTITVNALATSYPATYGVEVMSSFVTLRGRSLFVVKDSTLTTTTSAILSTASSVGIDFSATTVDIQQSSLLSLESNTITSTGQAAYGTAFRTSGTVTIGSGSQVNLMSNELTTANTPTAGLLIDGVTFMLFQKSVFSFSQNTIPGDQVAAAFSTSDDAFILDSTSTFAVGCDVVDGSTLTSYDNSSFVNL